MLTRIGLSSSRAWPAPLAPRIPVDGVVRVLKRYGLVSEARRLGTVDSLSAGFDWPVTTNVPVPDPATMVAQVDRRRPTCPTLQLMESDALICGSATGDARIAFVGAGVMAESMIAGLLKKPMSIAEHIVASHPARIGASSCTSASASTRSKQPRCRRRRRSRLPDDQAADALRP